MKYLKNFKTIFDALGAKVDVPCVVSIDGVSDVLIIPEDTRNAVNGKVTLNPALTSGGLVDINITANSEANLGFFITDDKSFKIKYGSNDVYSCSSIDAYITYMKDNTEQKYYYNNDNDYANTLESAIYGQKTYLNSYTNEDTNDTYYYKKDGSVTTDEDEAAESWVVLKYSYKNGYKYPIETDILASGFDEILMNDIYHWLYIEPEIQPVSEPQVTT